MKNQYFLYVLTFVFGFNHIGISQIPHPENGIKESKINTYVLKNANVLVSPKRTLRNVSLIIEDDKIKSVGKSLTTPRGAMEIDLQGKTVVPSFIESYSSIGVKDVPENKSPGFPQLETSKKGAYYWNEAIHPEIDATNYYQVDKTGEKELQKMGFSTVVTHYEDGVSRGLGAVVAIGSLNENEGLISPSSAAFFSFEKGKSKQAYPSSLMGSIALLRQAIYDAIYHEENKDRMERNLSLEALASQLKKPMVFLVKDKLEAVQVQKIGEEFDLEFVIIGGGNEYEQVESFKDSKTPMILPINFKDLEGVNDPYFAQQFSLQNLKHWELAPSNPYILKKNNVDFAITSMGIKDSETFFKSLTKVIERGLSKEDALAALTTIPAKIFGIDDVLGTLESGKLASFSIFDLDPFEYKNAKVYESWAKGKRTIINNMSAVDIRGRYRISLPETSYVVSIEGKADKPTIKLENRDKQDTTKIKVSIEQDFRDVIINIHARDSVNFGVISLRGNYNPSINALLGQGLMPDGRWVEWSGVQLRGGNNRSIDKKIVVDTLNLGKPWFPNMAYGFDSLPKENIYVLRNATLWTNESEGILKDGTVIIKDGKIDFVGTGNFAIPPNAIEIDCDGMHVTSGIIDEHSHIAISKGVNEMGQSVTSEVRIGDVVKEKDINIYRQLAGGVTVSNLLHGSANAIGGQAAIIKLKWGFSPEEMLVKDQPKFIKFALGENVKQSNWGERQVVRFPQTRMGVEQLMIDAFSRAYEYRNDQRNYSNLSLSKKKDRLPPARDLELDALVEILEGDRHITCHSYVASEINMLMAVAEKFDFKVNTFTHILEGYKVADRMAEHGAGGSTFSDWWAYKYEVNDAIPHNAALMANQGVVVAISSDDAEMGGRLNQEAAKSVKYGGMAEEDAWKMVTLNPAKLLRLDDRMGSLKEGKDADVVIWTDNPLSSHAKVSKTFIDGLLLYDADEAVEHHIRIQKEKARIISKISGEGNEGKK